MRHHMITEFVPKEFFFGPTSQMERSIYNLSNNNGKIHGYNTLIPWWLKMERNHCLNPQMGCTSSSAMWIQWKKSISTLTFSLQKLQQHLPLFFPIMAIKWTRSSKLSQKLFPKLTPTWSSPTKEWIVLHQKYELSPQNRCPHNGKWRGLYSLNGPPSHVTCDLVLLQHTWLKWHVYVLVVFPF